MKNALLLLAALLTLVASCNKDNAEPNPTCGEPRAGCANCEWNVFRCKVNGEDWCANCEDGPLFGCDPVDCQFYPEDNWLGILPKSTGDLLFKIYNFGDVSLTDTSIISFDDDIIFNTALEVNCQMYNLDTISKYFIHIKDLDIVSKLIEGDFEFTAFNECQDTVRVTDGYFKLTYRP